MKIIKFLSDEAMIKILEQEKLQFPENIQK